MTLSDWHFSTRGACSQSIRCLADTHFPFRFIILPHTDSRGVNANTQGTVQIGLYFCCRFISGNQSLASFIWLSLRLMPALKMRCMNAWQWNRASENSMSANLSYMNKTPSIGIPCCHSQSPKPLMSGLCSVLGNPIKQIECRWVE